MYSWRQRGIDKHLAVKKKVFWEARDAATCDSMLKQYQSHISSGQDAGALLVCVVGAKLSEGTGFIATAPQQLRGLITVVSRYLSIMNQVLFWQELSPTTDSDHQSLVQLEER